MRALARDAEVEVDGYLFPGHVSVMVDSRAFDFVAEEFGMPSAAVGFAPTDVIRAVEVLIELLRTFVAGAACAAAEAGVAIVASDTKVVPRGKGDRAYVTTAGLGVVPPERDLGDHRIVAGDAVLRTLYNTERPLDLLAGAELPRTC